MAWEYPRLENFIERAVILTRGKALEVPLTELRKTETEMAVDAVVNQSERLAKHSAQDLISTPALRCMKGSSARKSYRRLPHARAA